MGPAYASLVTAGGGNLLLPIALLLPVVAALVVVVAGGRHGARIALVAMLLGLVVVAAIARDVLLAGGTLQYVIGGWSPPLGLRLRADGLSAAMMLTTAIIMLATAIYARADFASPDGEPESRRAYAFWTLLLGLWAAMNAVFLGHDLFNLFVALELLTFSAVPLVCLDGKGETLKAALRYLLFALLGSVLYLLGAALMYGAYGTLDITLLAARIEAGPATWCRGGAHDDRIAGEDRRRAAAPVAAARARRRAAGREHGALGAGGQGLVLHPAVGCGST